MATKILAIKLLVTVPEKPPQEMIENYIKGCTESPDKAYKQLKEVINDIDTIIEKIIKPRIKGHQRFFRRDATNRSGSKIRDSLKPTREELERQARLWLKKVKRAYRYKGKEYAEIMKVMADLWGKKMLSSLAITGYQDEIRGVGRVVARYLTGDETVLELISKEEIIKKGPLVDIIRPDYGGTFRKAFNRKILSVGKPVIANNHQPGDIIYANEQINRLVSAFASNKFAPFTPGGDSHVDFMMVDGKLFLDVQVSIK